jgi:hypothetical protein
MQMYQAKACTVITELRKSSLVRPVPRVGVLIMGACVSVAVKALCYKPEGHGFQTRRGERIFLIYLIFPAALGPGVYSASNRNEY